MILVGLAALIGVFIAGFLLEAHTVFALGIVGACALLLGVLFAALETYTKEGARIRPGSTYTWSILWMSVMAWALEKRTMLGEQPLYVQTPSAVVPVQGVFFGKMNGATSIFIDTVAEDPAHTFNTLKQGVM